MKARRLPLCIASIVLGMLVAGPLRADSADPPPSTASQEILSPTAGDAALPVELAAGGEAAPIERLAGDSNAGSGSVATMQYAAVRSWQIGVRGGYYFDAEEPFVGLELLTPLFSRLSFNPNAEWIFVKDVVFMTFNADLTIDFSLPRTNAFMWVGGGLGVRYVNPEGPAESDADTGANILAGIGVDAGSYTPYAQAKWFRRDGNTEFILMGGIRF